MSDAVASNPFTVMVVDDSKVQLQFAVDLCRAQGWEVADTASDGMEALLKLKKCGANHPDLMLLDLEMPGLNGIDLLQELARLKLKMPILILSSRELSLLESVGQMSRQSGLNIIKIVQKPLSVDALHSLQNRPEPDKNSTPIISHAEMLAGLSQLQTVYTPSVSLDTGLIHHLCARLAWRHPEQGLLFPINYAREWQDDGDFLRAMQQHQLQVVQQIQHWIGCGLSMAVQVELLLPQMQTALHARSLLNQLAQYGIAENKLIFEVPVNTEDHAPLSNTGALNLLRIQNIGLAIRDDNLEFNWVRQIRNIPFSQLTICNSLSTNLTDDPLSNTLTRHSIALSHDLNMSVHAEGLASIADWHRLHQLGCNTAQGPLIGTPLSADEVIPWIKENLSPLRQLATQCAETVPQI